MPGNELAVAKYIFKNLNNITLDELGLIKNLGLPNSNNDENLLTLAHSIHDIDLISSSSASKKADFYLNGIGISVKQSGGNFSFNRLQRANLISTFDRVGIKNKIEIIKNIDTNVINFHNGTLIRRNIDWNIIFKENDFKKLLRYLMLEGSQTKDSKHKAEYILVAPAYNFNQNNIKVYNFENYFNLKKLKFKIAIRRQWIGQSSNSEHKRAMGLIKKLGNSSWVFNNVVGEPNTGWRVDFPIENRKTVYFLMIEEVK